MDWTRKTKPVNTYKSSSIFSWTQSTTWPIDYRGVEITDAEKADLQNSGYKIGLRIGGLFLTVFHIPLKRALPGLWKFRQTDENGCELL